MDFIDLSTQQQKIRSQLDLAIGKVLDHGRYIMGPEVFALEEQLAEYVGARNCISVSSGTDSLLIAMMALGIGPGDEVISVPYTWISTAETIALLGAKPVFVDICAKTLNLDETLLEAAITEHTKAIMPVGIYGQVPNMSRISEIAAKHSLSVIEDAAQSFGATHHGKKSCGLTLVGSTSFFPSKPLGGYGDGGALFTDDDQLAERFRYIRLHGQESKNFHSLVGINGRMDTIQAAIVLEKLKLFDNELLQRQNVADNYKECLASVPQIRTLSVSDFNTCVWAQYPIFVKRRDDLLAFLKTKEIPTVAYYPLPLHLQPVFSDLGHVRGDFPVAEQCSDNVLCLPMDPYKSHSQIRHVCESIKQFYRDKKYGT